MRRELQTRRGRAVAGLALLALVAGVVIGAAGGGDGGRRVPPGGSRFSPAASTAPAKVAGRGFLEALAPTFAEAPDRHGRGGRALTFADVARRLPLERRVAQLFVVGMDGATAPRDPIFEELLRRDWGGLTVAADDFQAAQQFADLTGEAGVVARNARHLPPLIVAAQDGGPDSPVPDAPPGPPEDRAGASAASARAEGQSAGAQLRLLGVNTVIAPPGDVDVEGGGVHAGSLFSDDERRVARIVAAESAGYAAAGMIAAVGHFPGEGSASQDPLEGPAIVGQSLAGLRARDLRPFAAVARRAPVIVISNALFAAFDGITPAVLDPAVHRLLRRGLRFQGVAMSDDLVGTATATGGTVGQAAVAALRAGADLLWVPGSRSDREGAYRAVLAAARSGRIGLSRIDGALARVLALKHRYGLITRTGATATPPPVVLPEAAAG